MPCRTEAEEAGGAGDLLDEQDPAKAPRNEPRPPKMLAPPENHRRNALKRVVLTDRRIADTDLTGEQQPANAREERAKHVGEDDRPVDARSEAIRSDFV